MKTTTKEILMATWNRNRDLADVMANVIEHHEGWDKVIELWGKIPAQRDWQVFQEANREEWG